MKVTFSPYSEVHNAYVAQVASDWHHQYIIDIGCGSGQLTRLFGEKNRVVGIDINDNVVLRYRNFNFTVADAAALPFPDAVFDRAVSFDVIEHVEDDAALVREAYRVLKPGGKLVLGTPNRQRLSNILRAAIGQPVRYPFNLGDDPTVGPTIHLREYTADELRNLITAAGFGRVQVQPFWFGITTVPSGLVNLSRPLQPYCQYWFVEAEK